jgi:hypothetical protein
MRPHPGPNRLVVALATALVAAVLGCGLAPAAGAAPPVPYAPPVDAPVTDGFRRPANPYAAGNRGIDYATEPGTVVRAAAGGEVTFAGQVGGGLHVVVLHPDGLRTSYSFLATVGVARGQAVAPGEPLGTTGASLHFGARAGEHYVDPAQLLAGSPAEVHLVPLEDRVPQAPEVERRWLLGTLRRAAGAGSAAARWLASSGAAAGSEAVAVAADVLAAAVTRRIAVPLEAARAVLAARRTASELLADQAGCTPGSVPVPAPPPGRRIVVLVAGYGSSGGDADVLDVDTDALGYAPADRVQFSYAGGRVPGVGALAGVRVAGYGPADAMGDLRRAGARLRRLLDGIAASHPGVPVDVVAHSQGGLVARQALSAPAGVAPPALPVEHLVTLGTPHHGAALASVAVALGAGFGDGLGAVTGGAVDPGAPAVVQLAEGSAFLAALGRRRLPEALAVTSIAATGDLVVPAVASTLAGATNALVPLAGATAHARLPGSAPAARALALALAGRAPTCTATAVLVARAVAGAAVGTAERALGTALAPEAVLADRVAAVVAAAAR